MEERPVYLDLTKIRLPMSAFSSITHRLSGMYAFYYSSSDIVFNLFFNFFKIKLRRFGIKNFNFFVFFYVRMLKLTNFVVSRTNWSKASNNGFFSYWRIIKWIK